MSVSSIRLGDVVEVVMGQAPPGEACNKDGDGTVFVKAGEFQERYPVVREWTTTPLKLSRPDDVLVCVVGATAGKVNQSSFDCAIGRSVAAVRAISGKLNSDFLFHFLKTKVIQLRSGAQGAAQGVITREMIHSLPLMLPPLSEQIRIAAILDQADALRVKRREALAQLDRLTQSIFIEMFGGPVTNPKGIKQKPLGDLLKLKSGNFLPATDMVDSGSYPVYGGNGINGYHDQFMFSEPQIIIGRVGVYCGCVHVSPPRSWVTDNALYVSESAPQLNFGYLAYSLKQAKLNQYASQSAQPLISGARLYPVKILVPSLEQQCEFTRRIAVVEKLRNSQHSSLSEFDALFVSLQHRAFRGEL